MKPLFRTTSRGECPTPQKSDFLSIDGVELFIVSAFRSIARQVEIIRGKVEAGQQIEAILSVSAPPGYSEHHSGCAIDLSTPGVECLTEAFEDTVAFAWLNKNAATYGFSLSYPRDNAAGYLYEPWHWNLIRVNTPIA